MCSSLCFGQVEENPCFEIENTHRISHYLSASHACTHTPHRSIIGSIAALSVTQNSISFCLILMSPSSSYPVCTDEVQAVQLIPSDRFHLFNKFEALFSATFGEKNFLIYFLFSGVVEMFCFFITLCFLVLNLLHVLSCIVFL